MSINKEKIVLLGGTIGISLVSLVITLAVYNVQLSNDKTPIVQNSDDKNEIVFNNELTEEQKRIAQNLINELDKLDKNSSNTENHNLENIKESKTLNENNEKINSNSEKKDVELGEYEDENIIETVVLANKKISFIKPIEGKIGMNFSDEKLVYSKTLDEWLTHKAIDFVAPVGTIVKSVADGNISHMTFDKKYGYTIEIEHEGDYVSKYAGVKENPLLKVGDSVKQGENISEVAMPLGFEVDEGSHLHFEILKNGKNIEPIFID